MLARRVVLVIGALVFGARLAAAQHDQHPPAPPAGWGWTLDSNIFLTGNFQFREFRDFHQVESQNWLMGQASRRIGTGTLTLHGMLSFEPFTLRSLGSSQAFQTGETFDGAPLIDYQHPHDLFMALAAACERPAGGATLLIRGGIVDAPALGPTPFMHRDTASLHPTVPLGHHQLDASHITHGVVTAGLRAGRWQVEGSAFRGREPDENRTDLDLGALDSLAGRVSWKTAHTRAQLSVGRLAEPDPIDPGNTTRLTASVEHAGTIAGRAAGVTLAWGRNRERFSTESSWLGEATLRLGRRGTGYLRGEIADKHILEAGGLHPPGFEHPHIISTVGALTGGYVHDVWQDEAHSLSVGADVTGHRVPAELQEPYGRPVSIHVFGRWRVRAAR